jgi:hypothetical protein
MRLRGEHFFSRFTFTHPGLIRILKAATENLALADPHARRAAFERLARLEGINDAKGRPIASTQRDVARAATLAMIARLSEAPLAATQEERRLFELLFESAITAGFEAKMTAPSPSGFVPNELEMASERDAFVIWAPTEPAWRASLAAYALEQLHLHTIVVCREGALPNVRAQFVSPRDAGAALARARAVLDLSVNDPGDALALARLGLPLAVTYLSGAYELLGGVAIYRSWMQRDIELAALAALGLGAPRSIGTPAAPPRYSAPPTVSRSVSEKYVAHIPSGATLFDTHTALLTEALERSGADRAFSDGIRITAEPPGFALVERAFSLTRVQTQGTSIVRVPRVTGVLS